MVERMTEAVSVSGTSQAPELVSSEAKEAVRPAILVDSRSLRDYSGSLRHFLVGLSDGSHSAAVVCPPHPQMTSVLCPGVEFITYPLIRLPMFRRQNMSVLLERLERFKPTVLHSFGAGRARLARRLSQQLNLPYVLTFNRPGRRILEPRIDWANCPALVASSRSLAAYLNKAYSRHSLRVRQINLATYVDDDCACFARSHGVPSLIVAQRLDSINEFEPLLHAVRHLVLDGHELVMAIIGSGRAEGKLYSLIRSLGLSQVVSVVPEIQPLRAVFAGADVFVQPRPHSEFNSRLLEAMSVGLAVAACEGSLDDMLITRQTAVFFDSSDELNIFEVLGSLLTDREMACSMAKAGQEYLRRHHTVSRMTSALIQTYQAAQQKHRKDR